MVAIYPGSFDPPTLGHLDVIERAARLFDRIVVAVGVNSAKASSALEGDVPVRGRRPLLTGEQRIHALRESTQGLSNVSVEAFKGLLVEYATEKGAKVIVRGLRATADFEYEFQMAMVNRRLSDQIETLFLMTKWEHSYLSSSIVREVALLGGDYKTMVHPAVAKVIAEALKR